MKIYHFLTVILLVFSFLTACQGQPETSADVKPMLFTELYQGDLSKVDKLTIRNGSTGELRTITDKAKIVQWLQVMKDVRFVPDPNQEPRSGWRYWVSLYEGENKVFELFPNNVNGVYYLTDEKVMASMEELFKTAKKEK
ncbi:hypothetical protein G3578_16645 [Brevibacillus sp. SYP-B805]|uniref:hypothetical protein n=1 Tax=Brevibacillus sp. SYP-B805 TaxID=1578199 RepID=UPI0013ECE626|nr:hypothetical protein [Brevibacillus sp. SYP-B805]NGQ96795.1 hypothetical protein [Brevibacillus sp. SYP-B805]